MRITIISLLLLFLLNSCHPLFCNWNQGYTQLTVEPDKNKVIGEYKLSKKSQEYLNSDFSKYPLSIILLEKGRYKINGDLDNWKTDNNKWFISCEESYGCMLELEGISVEPFSQKEGKYAIQITIGDGDECSGIIYEKLN